MQDFFTFLYEFAMRNTITLLQLSFIVYYVIRSAEILINMRKYKCKQQECRYKDDSGRK